LGRDGFNDLRRFAWPDALAVIGGRNQRPARAARGTRLPRARCGSRRKATKMAVDLVPAIDVDDLAARIMQARAECRAEYEVQEGILKPIFELHLLRMEIDRGLDNRRTGRALKRAALQSCKAAALRGHPFRPAPMADDR